MYNTIIYFIIYIFLNNNSIILYYNKDDNNLKFYYLLLSVQYSKSPTPNWTHHDCVLTTRIFLYTYSCQTWMQHDIEQHRYCPLRCIYIYIYSYTVHHTLSTDALFVACMYVINTTTLCHYH